MTVMTGYRPVLEDPAAAHQIRLIAVTPGNLIAVLCTCQLPGRTRRDKPQAVIEARKVFPAADALAAWRAWHEDKGVTV
jgi:hypothetical protein